MAGGMLLSAVLLKTLPTLPKSSPTLQKSPPSLPPAVSTPPPPSMAMSTLSPLPAPFFILPLASACYGERQSQIQTLVSIAQGFHLFDYIFDYGCFLLSGVSLLFSRGPRLQSTSSSPRPTLLPSGLNFFGKSVFFNIEIFHNSVFVFVKIYPLSLHPPPPSTPAPPWPSPASPHVRLA